MYNNGEPLVTIVIRRSGQTCHPPSVASPSIPDLDADAILGQARSENFPVASFFLPRRVRVPFGGHLRVRPLGRRHRRRGRRRPPGPARLARVRARAGQRGTATHPILVRLMPTLSELSLPLDPFRALIEANRVDQTVRRYETMEELADYCRLSAVPVGRLVLLVLRRQHTGSGRAVRRGVHRAATDRAPPRHRRRCGPRQDLSPARDRTAFGVTEDELLAPVPAPRSDAWWRYTSTGRAVAWPPGGPSAEPALATRAAVAGFVGGGEAALEAIRRAGYDVLGTRCRPHPLGVVARLAAIPSHRPTKAPDLTQPHRQTRPRHRAVSHHPQVGPPHECRCRLSRVRGHHPP